MLKGVLDAQITSNIIRLGSRYAADERIMEFSLENAEKLQAKSKSDRMINAAFREMKTSETEMVALMNKLALRDVPPDHLEKHLLLDYPIHYEELFTSPPEWVWTLALQSAEAQVGWQTAGKSKQQDFSIIQFWLTGRDLAFLRPPQQNPDQPQQVQPQGVVHANPYDLLAEETQGAGDENGKWFDISSPEYIIDLHFS